MGTEAILFCISVIEITFRDQMELACFNSAKKKLIEIGVLWPILHQTQTQVPWVTNFLMLSNISFILVIIFLFVLMLLYPSLALILKLFLFGLLFVQHLSLNKVQHGHSLTNTDE